MTPRLTHRFDSTRVATGKWDPDRKLITVEFVDGVEWVYEDCDEDDWVSFTKAASPGRYIANVLDLHHHRPG